MAKSPIFQSIPVKRLKRTAFDLSHHNKFTCGFGQLVPFLWEPVVPGDQFKVRTESFVRMLALNAPILHNVNVTTHYFFVPYRLLWKDWENFFTEPDAKDKQGNLFVKPTISCITGDFAPAQGLVEAGAFSKGSLADYLNLHIGSQSGGQIDEVSFSGISQLPFRAYYRIWFEWYRDQNLQDFDYDSIEDYFESIDKVLESEDLYTEPIFVLQNRSFRKDEFTSALPDPQIGQQVSLPLGGSASLSANKADVYLDALPHNGDIFPEAEYTFVAGANGESNKIEGFAFPGVTNNDDNTHVVGEMYADLSDIDVDLSNATASTVEDLRLAVRVQTFLERIARSGRRYIERILGEFGVRSSDARLQRSEYLGGGVTPIIVSEVPQTSATGSGSTPQANLAGKGVSLGNKNNFNYKVKEFGIIMGIFSITPESSYQQGMSQHWFKNDMLDYYHPDFAHLGEQEIKYYQIYAGTSKDNDTFGYTPRYAEYKYHSSEVHGEFLDTLSFWHAGRIFSSRPELNEDFIVIPDDNAGSGLNRIFADTSSKQNFVVELFIDEKAVRPMPKFGVPSLL